ncbi:MAG: FtsX-like permease family protein, partial [Anaerolineae bacterium]
FAMSITARTREIGTLRALGMTRRQVIRTVLLEAGVLGLTGIVAGVLVGLGLAWGVMRLMDTLDDAPVAAPGWGLTFSALMGLTVTFASALGPARRAGRVSPLVAARPETTLAVNWYIRYGGRLGAWILALALVGVTACGFIFRPDALTAQIVMIPAQAALMGAAILLLPALIAPLTALIRPLLARRLGTAGRLAADNLARNKLRAVLTAGGLTAGLTIIIATSGLMTAGLKGSFGRLGLMLGEDSFLTGNLGALVTSGEMSVENFFQFISADEPPFDLLPVLDALAPLVDANIIEVERNRFAAIPPQVSALPGAPGLFVDPEIFLRLGNFEFFAGDAETALEWMRRGQAVLLQPIAAERLGVKVGDAIPLQTPRGEVEFTVAGIGGSGWNMPIFPYADGETYFNVTAPSHLGIVVPQGQNIEAALAQVRQAIEPFPEMTLSSDYGNPFDPLAAMVGRLELLLNALLLLAVVVAALGVVNTMVINVTERGREIGLLRAVGATQRQVRRAVVAEAATLGLLAALAAGGLSLLMLLTWGLLVLPNGTASIGVRPDWETI